MWCIKKARDGDNLAEYDAEACRPSLIIHHVVYSSLYSMTLKQNSMRTSLCLLVVLSCID